ncbi:gfo/Idh/MocA family oxidoreductase, partial [Arthrobacter sp. KR32]|nr:gfo/Idh/MocA family oxidoreductase [Arthrobacter bussei]
MTAACRSTPSSFIASCPGQATVCGSKGWLKTGGGPLHNPRELTISAGHNEVRVEHFEQVGAGYTYKLREVTRCIQEGL